MELEECQKWNLKMPELELKECQKWKGHIENTIMAKFEAAGIKD